MLPYSCGIRTFRRHVVENHVINYFALTSDVLPYTRGPCILRVLGVKNYSNNYFAIYTRLTHARLHVELASAAYLRLAIIIIMILPCMHV